MFQQFLKIQAKNKNKKPSLQCRAALWPTTLAYRPSTSGEAARDDVVACSSAAVWRLAGGKV
jgi:hypothetical protein